MPVIDKQSLNHLAQLARITLTAGESKKLLKDLEKILAHFEELRAVETAGVEPMTGGTALRSVFRDDVVDFSQRSATVSHEGRIISAFPETERGYLKVPRVF